MPVERHDDGRRSVQAEVEVPGTPEEVWNAIATGPGITAWFVPTTMEMDADGKPVKIIANFGPGMESVSEVTGWDPPRSLTADSADFGPEGPMIATQWIVEARAGGTCVVRVVHSLFASTDEWDDQMEGWESGWPDFFRILRLYLTHFSGQPSAAMQVAGFHAGPTDAAWRTLLDGLRIDTVSAGASVESSGDGPAMHGVAEFVGEGGHPEQMLLRLSEPTPGIAHLFAMKMGERVMLSIRFLLYGPDADSVAKRETEVWQSWLGTTFPEPQAETS